MKKSQLVKNNKIFSGNVGKKEITPPKKLKKRFEFLSTYIIILMHEYVYKYIMVSSN